MPSKIVSTRPWSLSLLLGVLVPAAVKRFAFILPAVTLALSGCDWPLESDDGGSHLVDRGVESDYRSYIAGISAVTTPDTVEVGSEFEVVMLSHGPDGCWRAGPSVVHQINPLSVTIIPYDEEYVGSESVCTQAPVELRHSVHLLASVGGTFDVNVRRAGGGVIQRTVVVR